MKRVRKRTADSAAAAAVDVARAAAVVLAADSAGIATNSQQFQVKRGGIFRDAAPFSFLELAGGRRPDNQGHYRGDAAENGADITAGIGQNGARGDCHET